MRFLRPDLFRWWLVVPLLVAAWGVHWRVTRAFRRRARSDARFVALSRRSTWRRDAAVLAAALVAASAIVFALMRPQVLRAQRVPEYERQDLIVMLDRSVSMRARDILPSRFVRATEELRTLLLRKPEGIDRVALVGFADSALVLSYLTNDVDSVVFYLDRIDEDAAVLFGTNIGAALKSAMDIAKKDDRKTRKRLLLLSDGEDYGTELNAALDDLRAGGYRVDCIGIGSDRAVPIPLTASEGDPSTLREPQGRPEQSRGATGSGSSRATSRDEDSFLRDDSGRRVTTKYEEATLTRVAATTGGRYVRSTTGTELERAMSALANGDRRIVGWRLSTEYRDLYPLGVAVAAAAAAALCLLV